jgi:hypothetical protein
MGLMLLSPTVASQKFARLYCQLHQDQFATFFDQLFLLLALQRLSKDFVFLEMALSVFRIDHPLLFPRQRLLDLKVKLRHQPQVGPSHQQAYQLAQMAHPLQRPAWEAQDRAMQLQRSFLGLDLVLTLNYAVVAFVERLQRQHRQMARLLKPVRQRQGRMSHQTLPQGQAVATTD